MHFDQTLGTCDFENVQFVGQLPEMTKNNAKNLVSERNRGICGVIQNQKNFLKSRNFLKKKRKKRAGQEKIAKVENTKRRKEVAVPFSLSRPHPPSQLFTSNSSTWYLYIWGELDIWGGINFLKAASMNFGPSIRHKIYAKCLFCVPLSPKKCTILLKIDLFFCEKW